MYDNIGGKIKTLAVWTFIVEAVASIITGFILMAEEDTLYILLCLVGPIIAWVSSWLLYAFGELVEKTCDNENNTRHILNIVSTLTKVQINDSENDTRQILNELSTLTFEQTNNFENDTAINQAKRTTTEHASDGFWICSCQRENGDSRTECWHCGNKRPE